MKRIFILFLLSTTTANAGEKHPYCNGIENWATSIAYTSLKDDGVVTPETIDYSKTVTKRLTSEKISKGLYKQVHHILFTLKSGATVQVITVNDASNEECSMSDVDVYVISKKL